MILIDYRSNNLLPTIVICFLSYQYKKLYFSYVNQIDSKIYYYVTSSHNIIFYRYKIFF